MRQLTLFAINNQIKKKTHTHKKALKYYKTNKVKENIKIWNTIKHVYRYQTLYKICNILYLLTYNNQLSCLEYYNDVETENNKVYSVMYAEIEETSALSIKERVLKHIKLLRDIKNGVELEHDIKKIDSDNITLFS